MSDVPAIVQHPGKLLRPSQLGVLPALIADVGEQASSRYVESFTANISNPNTRRAYARACGNFLAWCDERGLTLPQIRPHDVASYIEDARSGGS